MSNYSVSVIIPAYNAEKTIRDTIVKCLEQDYSSGRLEIIVVDDGSVDKTAQVVKEYPVKYLYQENAGPAKARNLGFQNSRSEIIFFIDADCIPRSDWVSGLLKHYTEETVGGCGGSYALLNPDSMLARCIHQEILYRHSRIPKECRFLGSYNVSFRKKVLVETGGFNEDYKIASGEDIDLSYKILKKGYKLIFDKDIRVLHPHPESLMKYLRQQYGRAFWRMMLYKQHPEMMQGDDYSDMRDFIQPPLCLILLLLIPFSLFFYNTRFLIVFITFLLIILQLPVFFYALKKTKDIKYFVILPVNFLRCCIWSAGMVAGILKCFCREGKKT